MPEYVRKIFDLVQNGEYVYYKLVIDGKCQFDEFLEKVDKSVRDKKSLIRIVALMDAFSAKLMLPSTKFRHLQLKDVQNVYEFKKDLLRVYVLKEEKEITIILGGYKAEQEKDIAKVQRIVKDYSTNN